MDSLRFQPVDASSWPDFVRLFESRGGPSYCWCMAWRAQGAEVKYSKAERRTAMERRVQEGTPIGILAWRGGEPVGWCSIAPRETYRELGGPKDDARVWSLACFYIPRALRKQGLSRELLQAAIAHASARGAEIIEAYPVDPDSPSYRFMGFVALYEEAGFVEVGRAGSRRHVMRYTVPR